MQKVCIFGLGYIGLPTAAVLASRGYNVMGYDINPKVITALTLGTVHFEETNLEALVHAGVESGRLQAQATPVSADIFLIAVPTPLSAAEHKPDLSAVEQAATTLAPYLRPGNLVLLESTSPVGTTRWLAAHLAKLRPDLAISGQVRSGAEGAAVHVAYCPERVLPGRILEELIANDRVVGGVDANSTRAAQAFYASFVEGKVLTTTADSAELVKLTENASRDVQIAFANELANICDRLQLDAWEIIALANHHPRVNILKPGPGVGGHCIAVDPWFIVDAAPEEAQLIRSARCVNDGRPKRVIQQIIEQAKPYPDPVIACLGLSFKANVDDLRESPAIEIVEGLLAAGFIRVLVVEPHIDTLPAHWHAQYPHLELCTAETAIQAADVVALLVDHENFRQIDRALLKGKSVIDTRGLWR